MPNDDAQDDRLVLGLIDVLDLIAPGARADGWTALASNRSLVHEVDVVMPSGARTQIVILRHDDATTRDDALSVGATLERLRRGPVPAPEVLWLDPDGVVFGVPSTALTRVPGARGPGDAPLAWAASLAATLADVHLFPGELLEHLPVVSSAGELTSRLEAPAADLPRSDAIIRALADATDRVEFHEARLVHGRIDHGAVLATDGAVTGVVDWRGAMRSDPRVDLGAAHALAWLAADADAASHLVETYLERTGRDADDLAFFGLAALCSDLGRQVPAIPGAAGRVADYVDWALG